MQQGQIGTVDPKIYDQNGYYYRDANGKPLPWGGSKGTAMPAYFKALAEYNAAQQSAAAKVAATQSSITSTALKFAGKPSIQPVKQDNVAGPTSAGAITAQRPQPGNPQVQQQSIAGSMRRRGRKFSLGAVLDSSDSLGA